MTAVRPWAEVVADLRELRTQSRLPNDAADLIEALVAERDAVVALVVAVDRYVDHHNEADEAVRRELWRAMTTANDVAAEAFKVYPL